MVSRLSRSTVLLVAALATPGAAEAQRMSPAPVHVDLPAGGEMERYLRALQLTGQVPLYPWSIRGFSPREADRLLPADSAHPWAERYDFGRRGEDRNGVWLLPPRADVGFNSGFPHGSNNGPRWEGRGLNAAASAGVAGRWGALSFSLAPEAFWAQNASFELLENGVEGNPYADGITGITPIRIDLPQRFGDGGYGRVDPGESGLRLDLPVIALGVSTGAQFWGGAATHPILLGNNAGGFPHGFLGTSAPVDLWIGRVHGRVVWGELSQSEYSTVDGAAARRFMSGAIAVFMPRGMPGLEVGGARFFHSSWPQGGLSAGDFLKPLEGLFKIRLPDAPDAFGDPDNQLASVFARWAFPAVGMELYGEYGREDHNWDLRDFFLQPDHISAFVLGFQKSWASAPERVTVLRGEVVDARASHLSTLLGEQVPDARVSHRFYVHTRARQGHTHRGQILGSPAVYGGAASMLGLDRYDGSGAWTVELARTLRADPAVRSREARALQDGSLDVLYALEARRLLFLGPIGLESGLSLAYNFDRNFQHDRMNVGVRLGGSWRP